MTSNSSALNSSIDNSGSILVLMFDTPVPVDYGGVYDVMTRLQVLKRLDYKLKLICVAREQDRLNYLNSHLPDLVPSLFSEIHVLPPRSFIRSAISCLPFSASIRKIHIPHQLLESISQSHYDFVLVEHLKMAALAKILKPWIKSNFYLRMHNDEALFYLNLSRESRRWPQKFIFFIESFKYRFFQYAILRGNVFSRIFFISSKDLHDLNSLCGNKGSLLPITFDLKSGQTIDAKKDIDFLYVGNLDSDDNVNALQFALNHLATNELKNASIMICGRCRTESKQFYLQKLVAKFPKIRMEFNVSPERLELIYQSTKFFLNFSNNSGGVKSKLADALSNDLAILTNEHGVAGSGLDDFCIHVNDEKGIEKIRQLLTHDEMYRNYIANRRSDLNEFSIRTLEIYKNSFAKAKL